MNSFLKNTLIILFIFSFLSCKQKEETEKVELQERKKVEMITNFGTMVFELYNETPSHRDNFIKLINDKAYDSLLFHRVIENFMIQGGDPDSRNAPSGTSLGEGDLDYTVKAEFHPDLFHRKGALATARVESLDRASSAIQFFIVQGEVYNDSIIDNYENRINKMLARHYTINDSLYQPLWFTLNKATDKENTRLFIQINDSINTIAKSYTNFERYTIPKAHREVYKTIGGKPHLDQNYVVFGQVIEGLEIVDSIAATKTNNRDRPIADVIIQSVRVKN